MISWLLVFNAARSVISWLLVFNAARSVDKDTGMVTMQKGVPSNTQASPYVFQVRVEDRKFGSTVTSTVSVVIHDLPEEAVRNSGAVRLKGVYLMGPGKGVGGGRKVYI